MKKLLSIALIGSALFAEYTYTSNVSTANTVEYTYEFGKNPDCNLTVVEPQNSPGVFDLHNMFRFMCSMSSSYLPFGSGCGDLNTTITTQIVNKPFNMSVVCADRGGFKKWGAGIVAVELVKNEAGKSCSELSAISDKEYFFFLDTPIVKVGAFPFVYDKAVKDVKFRVYYPTNDFSVGFNFENECKAAFEGYNDSTVDDNSFKASVDGCIAKIEAENSNNSDFQSCKAKCDSKFEASFGGDCAAGDKKCEARWKERHYLSCVMHCAFDRYLDGVNCSDNFAIRPEKFVIDLPSNIKAGEEFSATVKALDFLGKPTVDYNESVAGNSAIKFVADDLNPSAKDGDVSVISGAFSNGEAVVTLKYSEVGSPKITIKEIRDPNTFAAVDAEDEGDEKLLIASGSDVTNSEVYKLIFEGNLTNYKDGSFTYLSNDLNMSSNLVLNVKALNKDGDVTENFDNSLGYAVGGILTLKYDPSNIKAEKILYKVGHLEGNSSVSGELNITILPDWFNTGKANLTVYLNFDKNYSNPVNEFSFSLSELKYNLNSNYTLDKNLATFRYARFGVKNIAGYGNSLDENITIEYLKNNEWVVNSEHTSDYGNLKSIVFNDADSNHVSASFNDVVNGSIVAEFNSTTTPYRAKAHYDIPSYLWYNPLATEYKAPSSTNLDCTTHPCSTISFLSAVSASNKEGWAGVGKESKRYSEENKTVKYDLQDEVNVTKKEVRRVY